MCAGVAEKERITSLEPVYQGVLPINAQLTAFLCRVLREQPGIDSCAPHFEAYRLDQRGVALRFDHPPSARSLVGKFFARKASGDGSPLSSERAAQLMWRERDNLCRLRALGLDGQPYQVPRPLGVNPKLESLLITEHIPGNDLDATIQAVISTGEQQRLLDNITALAGLLATLHLRSQSAAPATEVAGLTYLDGLRTRLFAIGIVDGPLSLRLATAAQGWRESRALHIPCRSLVHGDATPVNFRFAADGSVAAIDVERLHLDDPALDLGYLAGELKHGFFLRTGDPWAGEWAIRRLHAAYAQYAALAEAAFGAFTRRAQFYMGCCLLRIARNDWLDRNYRRRLVEEGINCLN